MNLIPTSFYGIAGMIVLEFNGTQGYVLGIAAQNSLCTLNKILFLANPLQGCRTCPTIYVLNGGGILNLCRLDYLLVRLIPSALVAYRKREIG